MTWTMRSGLVPLLAGLTGCVIAPPPLPQWPLVAVPGPAKTEAEFHQDDTACRVAAAPLPTSGYAESAPATSDPAQPAPPGASASGGDPASDQARAAAGNYLHCMESHNNVIQPLAPPRLAAYPYYSYGYAPSYGPYDGYSPYPWLYDGYPGFGIYGFYGAYYGGGFRAGYGGGFRGAYGGGFHGGYGGGFNGGDRGGSYGGESGSDGRGGGGGNGGGNGGGGNRGFGGGGGRGR